MKNLFTLLIILLISQNKVHSQFGSSCLPEGITFTTQAQIDSFQVNYPGCSRIGGDVTISDNWTNSIENLNGLSVITSIGGDLIISYDSLLTDLSGLDNLDSIGGSLTIYGNPFLENINNLSSLTFVGDGITIGIRNFWYGLIGNQSLTSLEGLEGITSLSGLSLVGNGLLEDLDGLNNLQDLGVGGLFIAGNSLLTSLSQLENLTEIDGSVTLGYSDEWGPVGNPLLTNLQGLSGLTEIGGSLVITGHYFSNLEGLNNLISIGQDFIIQENYLQMDMEGLDNLSAIGGKMLIGQYPGIGGTGHIPGGNPSLSNFQGVENLVSIGGDLVIGLNDTLSNLSGLENITSIGGDLIIHGNVFLTTLAGLDNVSPGSIHDLYIHNNPLLSNCDAQGICTYLAEPNGSVDILSNATGCNNPPEIADACGITLPCLPYGYYYLHSQAAIDSFAVDYPECFDLQGKVSIGGTDISSLEGLSQVTSFGGDVKISYCAWLSSLNGLNQVSVVGGSLEIRNNDRLTDITALENLTSVGVRLKIYKNGLSSLSGLENLESIGGQLWIEFNNLSGHLGLNSLKSVGEAGFYLLREDILDLSGLDSLSSIGGALVLAYLDSLNDVSALMHLNAIGGILSIHHNNSLTSLYGLDSIVGGSISELIIVNNNNLSECAVNSICEYLASPGGNVQIQDNAEGCDSEEEVIEECLMGIQEPVGGRRPVLGSEANRGLAVGGWPNPFSGTTNIEYEIENEGVVRISVFNHLGQEVAMLVNERQVAGNHSVVWDAGGLPDGVYYCRLQAGEEVGSTKLILMK